MSNCIHFVDGAEVVLSKKDISIPLLRALVNSSKEWEYHTKTSPTPEESKRNMAWWFLQENTDFIKGDEFVVIRIGQGRSIHTNRDFQGLLNTLAPIMKRERQHTFVITDEGFGDKTFWLRVDFRQGRIL